MSPVHVSRHAVLSESAIPAEAIRAGDRTAFARLFEENRPKLLALAYRMTSSASEAEDVVQDAFVSSLRHHSQFEGQARPSTWIYRVTINAALMRLRTRRRKGAESLDALPGSVAEAAVAGSTPRAPSPEDVVDRRRLQARVDRAVAVLKPLDRELVRLRFREGLTVEEVSEAVGLPLTTVKSRLHRARLALRDELQGIADSGGGTVSPSRAAESSVST